jgi:hypothetical protein
LARGFVRGLVRAPFAIVTGLIVGVLVHLADGPGWAVVGFAALGFLIDFNDGAA